MSVERHRAKGGGRSAKRRRKAREETSAGGVVYRREGAAPVFLLIRDSYHNWGFPKGHLEDGEQEENEEDDQVLPGAGDAAWGRCVRRGFAHLVIPPESGRRW